MYFWKIDRLKNDLVTGILPQNEQFKYLLAVSILVEIAMIPQLYLSHNWFDVLSSAIGVVITGFGTYHIYYCNGGQNGERFLERYLSLSWVVFIRYSVLVLIPAIVAMIAFYLIYFPLSEIPEDTRIPDVVITSVLLIVFYYLVGRHVREIAKHTP